MVQHVVFRDDDDRLREMWWSPTTGWQEGTLFQAAKNITAAGDPAGYVLTGSQHVVFRDDDDRLREMWWSPTTGWQEGTLFQAAKNITAAGDPAGYVE
jgi:hypothetical protein